MSTQPSSMVEVKVELYLHCSIQFHNMHKKNYCNQSNHGKLDLKKNELRSIQPCFSASGFFTPNQTISTSFSLWTDHILRHNIANGLLHRLCEGFLYFKNFIRFRDIRVNVLLFAPITKYRRPSQSVAFHETRKMFSFITCRFSAKSDKTVESMDRNCVDACG